MKKYILFCAAALVAAAACTREPVAPEEPEANMEGPLKVTLVAGSPDTRTELFVNDEGVLHPLWSAGDGLNVVTLDAVKAGYFGFDNVSKESGMNASFEGTVEYPGQYFAFYPKSAPDEYGDDYPYIDVYNTGYNNSIYGYINYEVPPIQYPSQTSFDPAADFLVSDPFTIEEDDFDPDSEQYIQNITFTRLNAIVKIVLKDNTADGSLTGQTVRKVSIGTMAEEEGGGGEILNVAPRTRADVWDDDDNYGGHGLAGYITFSFPPEEGNDPYYVGSAYNKWVTASYTDESAYEIGDTDAATYLITVPAILKNAEWSDYDDDYNEIIVKEGLFIKVETDEYAITRHIILPEAGIALEPSRVTTLNIKLYDDGVEGTSFETIGINLSKDELTLKPGKQMYLETSFVGINPTDEELCDLVWTTSDSDIVTVEPEMFYFGGDDLRDMTVVYSNRALVSAVGEGTATITATFKDLYTATCTVTVAEIPETPSAMVDLGLTSGTKWAQWNLGASSWDEEGDLYAWGETQWKNEFSWDTYRWSYEGQKKLTKYTNSAVFTPDHQIDNTFLLDYADDAAYVNWGSDWYIPTRAQWEEMKEECTWDYVYDDSGDTYDDNIIGYSATGPNGNVIYFSKVDYQEAELNYMCSTLPEPNKGDFKFSLCFYSVPLDVTTYWSSGESQNYVNNYTYYCPERGETGVYVRPVSGGTSLRKEPELGAITLEASGNAIRVRFPVNESERQKSYMNDPQYEYKATSAIVLYSTSPDVEPGNYFHGHASYDDGYASGNNHKYHRFEVEEFENNQVCSFIPQDMHGTIYYRAYFFSTVKKKTTDTNSTIANECYGVTRSVYIP